MAQSESGWGISCNVRLLRGIATVSCVAMAWLTVLGAAATDPMSLEPTASFSGEADSDYAGNSVAGVGDVNGDGYDDLLIGAEGNDEAGAEAGQAYLQFGSPALYQDQFLVGVDASFLGETAGDQAGETVAAGGDVDGDGYNDMLIAAPQFGSPTITGQVYLVLGGTAGWAMDQSLAMSDASYLGDGDGDLVQTSLASAGDLDGDLYDDFVISAPGNDLAYTDAGAVYLVFGESGGWAMGLSLASSRASYLGEVESDGAGYSVDGAGDFNGDGFDDLVIGAPANDDNGDLAGKAYLVLGQAGGWTTDVPLNQADASFLGENAGDAAGGSVARVGDVDGDGFGDLLIGAPYCDQAGIRSGKVYLVRGDANGAGVGVDLAASAASFVGENAYDCAGLAVAGVQDMDGDGFVDFMIGAPMADGGATERGRSYLVLGGSGGWNPDTGLIESDAWFAGDAMLDRAGNSISGTGDVDGDGYADLIIGAGQNDEYGIQSGQSYLIMGVPAADWDRDEDGYTVGDGDCDDLDPSINPGTPELCDGIDNDCDGVIPADETDDMDGDGFIGCEDCDDTNPTVYPGAPDICDAIDNDCDYVVDEDADTDGDGYSICEGDCDDTNILFRPGAPEQCDGEDNDCDGELPADEFDGDGDGWIECLDCDDQDPTMYPTAPDLCDDYIDSDCLDDLVHTEYDNDGDGYTECAGDCDDTRSEVYPGSPEVCDGLDNDCYGGNDESADMDQDGWSLCFGDCDDFNTWVYPGAVEVCDGLDNDCDGTVDIGDDHDLDGYSTLCDADCDDFNPSVNPSMPEIPYNGIDEDCDGEDAKDLDGDGHDGGHYGSDCNDLDAAISPSALEICDNGKDDDCDLLADSMDEDCKDPPPDAVDCDCDQAGRGRTPWIAAILGVWALARGRRR